MAAPRIPITDLPEHTTPTASDLLVVQNGPTTKKMQVGLIMTGSTAALDAHITNPVDAHDASAVSAIPNSAPMAGTDVQSQLNQAASGLSTLTTNLDTHKTAPNAHTASNIAFTPVGTIAATNVQAAIAEVAAEGGTGGGGGGGGSAADTTYDPTDNTVLTSTDVQGALDQADTRLTAHAGMLDPAVSLLPGSLHLYEQTTNGTNKVTLQVPAALAADRAITLPDASGTVAFTAQVVETVTGTTYTVALADASKIKRLTGTATVTLPSTGPAVGERVDFVCVGGPATFALGAGATWDVAPTPSAVARAVGSMVTAVKMTTSAWALTGDLA